MAVCMSVCRSKRAAYSHKSICYLGMANVLKSHYARMSWAINGFITTPTDPPGATENARPENAGLENDGQRFSKLWAKLRGLENARLENDGPC